LDHKIFLDKRETSFILVLSQITPDLNKKKGAGLVTQAPFPNLVILGTRTGVRYLIDIQGAQAAGKLKLFLF